MNTEKLLWSIFKARDEDTLHEIVMRDKLLSDNGNWFPYGGRDKNDRSNFGTFENQQANPVPALIEKITNSIDSLLLKKCRLASINPKGKEAPPDMAAAVEKLFGKSAQGFTTNWSTPASPRKDGRRCSALPLNPPPSSNPKISIVHIHS